MTRIRIWSIIRAPHETVQRCSATSISASKISSGSTGFYAGLMEILGHRQCFADKEKAWAAWQPAAGGRPLLIIAKPFDGGTASPGNGQMTAFEVFSRALVDEAHTYALREQGGHDEGAPGLRPHYHPNYYGAYFRNPDGNTMRPSNDGRGPGTLARPVRWYDRARPLILEPRPLGGAEALMLDDLAVRSARIRFPCWPQVEAGSSLRRSIRRTTSPLAMISRGRSAGKWSSMAILAVTSSTPERSRCGPAKRNKPVSLEPPRQFRDGWIPAAAAGRFSNRRPLASRLRRPTSRITSKRRTEDGVKIKRGGLSSRTR